MERAKIIVETATVVKSAVILFSLFFLFYALLFHSRHAFIPIPNRHLLRYFSGVLSEVAGFDDRDSFCHPLATASKAFMIPSISSFVRREVKS
jgi:hypothetical protein